MIQVHEIVDEPTSKETLEGRVNEWLEENHDVEIVDIKYGLACSGEGYTVTGALIIYGAIA